MNNQPLTRLELYRLGLSDYKIAKRKGTSTNSVRNWRNCLGLPPNPQLFEENLQPVKYSMTPEEWQAEKERFRELLSAWR